MSTIHVVGIDAAFTHMGFARVSIDTNANRIVSLHRLRLVSTDGQHKKEVRKSSDDLRRARELHLAINAECRRAFVAMAEIPSGSQSSRASWALGIAVGILASCPVPLIQVSQLEVKLASVGRKTASKDEMISWAMKHHPHMDWLLSKGKPVKANEHLADALATIYAGMRTDSFKLLCSTQSDKSPRVRLL